MALSNNITTLQVHVRPHASRSEVLGITNGVLQVRVAAPPVKGKANQEVIALLSRALEVGKSSVNIVKGQASRNKVITIGGLHRDEVMKRL